MLTSVSFVSLPGLSFLLLFPQESTMPFVTEWIAAVGAIVTTVMAMMTYFGKFKIHTVPSPSPPPGTGQRPLQPDQARVDQLERTVQSLVDRVTALEQDKQTLQGPVYLSGVFSPLSSQPPPLRSN